MFFEPEHSLDHYEFKLHTGIHLSFPTHIHRSFEYFEQVDGATEVSIENKKYLLNEGEAVLIFPLQPHAYTSLKNGQCRMCIFSPNLVSSFYKNTENKLPSNSKFFCRLPDPCFFNNFFKKKAIAYFICGEFEEGRSYVEIPKKNHTHLLISLLLFADQNFRYTCHLKEAAAMLGYDYAYISKYFKRTVKLPFRQYVNCLRITESKRLLTETLQSIEEVGEASGFSSLRSFDREFKLQTGLTPSEYRKKYKAP
ncbi:MAG: AraC family transcriptional regulator [Ruminococcaceae bacterium]|nr:AraC family transcriptional regulator [Oscillospiraceae bacterium]